MKLLYIGEETRNWIMKLCNELALLGHDVTTVVKKYDEYDDANKTLPIKGVIVIEVCDDTYFKPETAYDLVKNDKYDMVYGSHIITCAVTKYVANKMNIPYGIQVLDVPLDIITAQPSRMINWQEYVKILEDVATMTFITHRARDDWHDGGEPYVTYPGGTKDIPNGHYCGFMNGKKYSDENVIRYAIDIPEKWKLSGLECDDNYVVSFCRVIPFKNVSEATLAIGQLSKLGISQVVVGKSQGDLEHIKQIAKQYGVKVIYEPQVSEEEKFELIKNASAVVYPQRSEYIGGLSPFEAMYIGTPVVVFDYDILKSLYGGFAFYANKDPNVEHAYLKELLYVLSVDKSAIKNKLIKASDHAGQNNFKNMSKKLERVMKNAIRDDKN